MRFGLTAAAAAMMAGAPAPAAITFYTDEAAFAAAIGAVRVDVVAPAGLGEGESLALDRYQFATPTNVEVLNGLESGAQRVVEAAGGDYLSVTSDAFARTAIVDILSIGYEQTAAGRVASFGFVYRGFPGSSARIFTDPEDSGIVAADRPWSFLGFISTTPQPQVSIFFYDAPSLDLRAIYINPNADFPIVPEPASWALMIAGFGLAGAAARVSRARTGAPSARRP